MDFGAGTGMSAEIIGFEDELGGMSAVHSFAMPNYVSQTSPRPYLGGNAVNETITTPYGSKIVTRIEKNSKNRSLGGMAIPDFDVYLVNPNSIFPKDYVGHHERNHLREYEETGVPILDELFNRAISDKQYRRITGKFIDTVTPFEEQIKDNLLQKYNSEDAEAAMGAIRNMKNDYVDRNMQAVDLGAIAREFEMPKMLEAPKKEPEKEYSRPNDYII